MSENAEGYYGSPEIEFFPIIKAGTKPHKVTTFFKNVELWDNGQVSDAREWSVTDWAITGIYGSPPNRARVRYVRAPCHQNKGGRLEVVGNSAEVVAKVANEKIAMWKAGAWGGPRHGEILEEA